MWLEHVYMGPCWVVLRVEGACSLVLCGLVLVVGVFVMSCFGYRFLLFL